MCCRLLFRLSLSPALACSFSVSVLALAFSFACRRLFINLMFAHVHIDVSSEQFQLHSDLIYISAILYSPSVTLPTFGPLFRKCETLLYVYAVHKEAKEQDRMRMRMRMRGRRLTLACS